MMEESPKSLHSRYRVELTFKNKSDRSVELYWLDFKGKLVMYSPDLGPRKERKYYTFVTHPWVVRDSVSGQWMMLGGKRIFVTPKPAGFQENEFVNDDELAGAPLNAGAMEVDIHIPVYRLEDICLCFLRRSLKNYRLTEEDLNRYLLDKLSAKTSAMLTKRIYWPGRGIVSNDSDSD